MPSDRVVECPAHLTNSGSEGIAQAAAMPLAILTAYRYANLSLLGTRTDLNSKSYNREGRAEKGTELPHHRYVTFFDTRCPF